MLVVIGVHTPKFDNEKNTESIRKAILRYEIKHPVVNDADHKIWRRYGVSSWPTLVADRSRRQLRTAASPARATTTCSTRHIGKLIKEYRGKKTLNETPLQFKLAQGDRRQRRSSSPARCSPTPRASGCSSPTAPITASSSPTWHGKKIAVAGTGDDGLKDGAFAEAQFSDPQGMALDGDTLYVADRKNHRSAPWTRRRRRSRRWPAPASRTASGRQAAGRPSRPA